MIHSMIVKEPKNWFNYYGVPDRLNVCVLMTCLSLGLYLRQGTITIFI